MSAEIEVGSVLGERYEILAVLGEGAMGPVYKAQDRLLDETVALKTILAPGGSTFLRTAAGAVRRARARHAARIHDYGEHEGVRFVAMEFVDGVDLRAGTPGRGLDAREACDAVLQLCGALASRASQAEERHALALLLYELLTGEVFTRNPAGRVPAPIAPFLTRALAHQAPERFRSAAEMVIALRECVAQLGDSDTGAPLTLEAAAEPADPKRRPPDVETIVAMLATGLNEGDVGLRWRSAAALAELGPAAFPAVPVLIQALDDPDAAVRDRAMRALARIGPAAVTPLLAALKAPQEHVRFLAAGALTEIGSTARPETPRADEAPPRWPESRY